MTFVEVTDSVIVQPPIGGFTCTVSGSVYKGQAVYLINNYTVKAPTSDDKILYGVSGYNKTNGQKTVIYSVGNIVRCKVSSSSAIPVGTKVGVITGGYVSNSAIYNSGAIITKSSVSNCGDCEMLILGNGYSI